MLVTINENHSAEENILVFRFKFKKTLRNHELSWRFKFTVGWKAFNPSDVNHAAYDGWYVCILKFKLFVWKVFVPKWLYIYLLWIGVFICFSLFSLTVFTVSNNLKTYSADQLAKDCFGNGSLWLQHRIEILNGSPHNLITCVIVGAFLVFLWRTLNRY